MWAGTNSIHLEAQCWSDNPAISLNTSSCAKVLSAAQAAKEIPTLKVVPGATMGISVDAKVAKNGWVAKLGSNNLTPKTLHTTYWRFTWPQLSSLATTNQLIVLASGPTSTTYRGIWVYSTVSNGN